MIKILKKLLCMLAVMASQGWASENSFEFYSENFRYTSLTNEDKPAFEELRAQHNQQNNVVIVDDIFDNHITRQTNGNAWHILIIRNRESETNELVAGLCMGRIPSVVEKYNPDNHAAILTYFQQLSIIDENKARIGNSGIAHYVLMTDMEKMNPYLTELHTAAFRHCCNLANTELVLPVEKTNATVVGLFARPEAPDTAAMIETGYELTYKNETEETSDASRWYPGKLTNVWTKTIPHTQKEKASEEK